MKLITDICYSDKSERNKLDLYLPDCDEFPVFVHFHGGGIEAGDKSTDGKEIGEFLAKSGVAYVGVNYRMYPSAVYPEFIRDAAAAVAWTFKHISEYGKCDKIFVGGNSAGAYISMMLCYDKKYLAPYKINPNDIAGFVFDGAQPTAHFNVLRERGIDPRRAIVDETSPLYYIGLEESYPPMIYTVSDNDMPARLEQLQLVIATMKHFGYDESKFGLEIFEGTHGVYKNTWLGEIAYNFIKNH